MTRFDKRHTVELFPPDYPERPSERHTLLNARDLIAHQSWTTTPNTTQHESAGDLIAEASLQTSDEELARRALLSTPINQMSNDQLLAYTEEVFGTKLDKRLSQEKRIERIKELAAASGIQLNLNRPSTQDVHAHRKGEDGSIEQGSAEDTGPATDTDE